jgi:hypothetical protein
MLRHSLFDASVITASQVRIDIELISIIAESHDVPKLETMQYVYTYRLLQNWVIICD